MKNILLVFILFCLSSLSAQDADAIMKQSYELKEAETMKAEMTMYLRDIRGGKTERRLLMYMRKQSHGTDNYLEFLSPANVKGTRFLSLSQGEGRDQRMWLPELGKVRRIAGAGRYKSFMGSDLTYYDMEDRSFEDSVYLLKGEEDVEYLQDGKSISVPCWIIECIPQTDSPYASTLVWIGKNDFLVSRSEMYNSRKMLVKSVHIMSVIRQKGVIVPVKTLIVNASGHRTLLLMENVEIDLSLPDDLFSIRYLMR